MLYTLEMIKALGFDNADDFAKDYALHHPNCTIRFVRDGVYCDYEFDSSPGLAWGGTD